MIWALEVVKVSPVQFGLLTSVLMGTAILSYVPAAALAERAEKKWFVVLTYLFFTLFPVAVVLSRSFVHLVLAYAVGGLREIGEPARKALIVDLADPLQRGRTVGLYYSIRGFAVAGAAAIGGALWTVRPALTFAVAAGLGALGTLFAAVFLPSSSAAPSRGGDAVTGPGSRRGPEPTLAQMALYFLRLGALGFGGPVALANTMRRDLAEERHWLTEQEYEDGLAIAAACPGPLAYQLGVYCGYVRHGVAGGLAVAVAFALAPFALVVAAAWAYTRFSAAWQLRALFYGVAPVVVALIRESLLQPRKEDAPEGSARVGRRRFVACAITVVVQKELAAIFLVAGALGAFVFAPRPAATAPDRDMTGRLPPGQWQPRSPRWAPAPAAR